MQGIYEFRPFSEEVIALRLGARRRSTGSYACELQGCEPFYLWRGVAYIECARTPASPRRRGFKVRYVRGVTGNAPHKVSLLSSSLLNYRPLQCRVPLDLLVVE